MLWRGLVCRTPSLLSRLMAHSYYLDVHAHIVHEQFEGEEAAIAEKCLAQGVRQIVVNGLNPDSNRKILQLCKAFPRLYRPAIGIYPLDAACNVIDESTWKHPFPPPERFDVDLEMDFIEEMAMAKQVVAIGECGLDKYYLTDDVSMAEQERVLRRLMRIAKAADLPIILHTRKAEERVFQMLQEEGVVKADFHCFGGKVRNLPSITFEVITRGVDETGGEDRRGGVLPVHSLWRRADGLVSGLGSGPPSG